MSLSLSLARCPRAEFREELARARGRTKAGQSNCRSAAGNAAAAAAVACSPPGWKTGGRGRGRKRLIKFFRRVFVAENFPPPPSYFTFSQWRAAFDLTLGLGEKGGGGK